MPTLRLYPNSVIAAGRGFTLSQLSNVINNNKSYAEYSGLIPLDTEIGGTLEFPTLTLPVDSVISNITASIICKASVKNMIAFSSVLVKNSDGTLLNKSGLKNISTSNTTANVAFGVSDLLGLPMNAMLDPTLSWTFLFRSLNETSAFKTSWQKAYLDITYTAWSPPGNNNFMLTMEST